jgi:hypothetical protein
MQSFEAERASSELTLIADLSSTSAEDYGFRLPSHTHLWDTLLASITANIETLHWDQLAKFIERAETKTGVTIEELSLRHALFEGLERSAQTLLCRHLVAALGKVSIDVNVQGTGWVSPDACLAPTTFERRTTIAAASEMVLHLDLSGRHTADALNAAGCGATLLVRQSADEAKPGGIATLLEPGAEYVPFRTARELIESIKRLRREPGLRRRIAAAGRERCRRDHTPAQRLRALNAILTS